MKLIDSETKTNMISSERARAGFTAIAAQVRLHRYDRFEDGLDAAQVGLCKAWIGLHCRRAKSINYRGPHAYNFKHMVERWTETFGPHKYVSETSFLAAALELGYRANVTRASRQIYFAMSPKEDCA